MIRAGSAEKGILSGKGLQKGFLSKKGFLFTISVIFFASTMVFFVQQYSASNSSRERLVMMSASSSLEPYIVDDISNDLLSILGLGISTQSDRPSGDLNIALDESFPKGFGVSQALQGYKAFLDSSSFVRAGGDQSIDITNLLDGTADIYFSDLFKYSYYYDTNSVRLVSLEGKPLKAMAISMDVENDLNARSWIVPSGANTVPVTVTYVDNSLSFTDTRMIDPSQRSVLMLGYNDGNIELDFGLVDGYTNSFFMDSNAPKSAYYSLNASYSVPGIDSLPVFFDAVFHHKDSYVDANSYMRIIN